VNRAARAVAEARAPAVVATGPIRTATDDLTWTSLGVRELKGVGPVELHRLEV
jgi:class 3 adenylate cyclase